MELLAVAVGLGLPGAAAIVGVGSLQTEYLENPLGLDRLSPRFQWGLTSDAPEPRGLVQTNYRVLIGTDSADGSVWDSGVVTSNQTYQIKYGGGPLKSATVYRWKVIAGVQSLDGTAASAVSAPAMFSMGILSPADWGSDSDAAPLLVGPTADIPKATCPWFRKTFTLPPTATGTALVYLVRRFAPCLDIRILFR